MDEIGSKLQFPLCLVMLTHWICFYKENDPEGCQYSEPKSEHFCLFFLANPAASPVILLVFWRLDGARVFSQRQIHELRVVPFVRYQYSNWAQAKRAPSLWFRPNRWCRWDVKYRVDQASKDVAAGTPIWGVRWPWRSESTDVGES